MSLTPTPHHILTFISKFSALLPPELFCCRRTGPCYYSFLLSHHIVYCTFNFPAFELPQKINGKGIIGDYFFSFQLKSDDAKLKADESWAEMQWRDKAGGYLRRPKPNNSMRGGKKEEEIPERSSQPAIRATAI